MTDERLAECEAIGDDTAHVAGDAIASLVDEVRRLRAVEESARRLSWAAANLTGFLAGQGPGGRRVGPAQVEREQGARRPGEDGPVSYPMCIQCQVFYDGGCRTCPKCWMETRFGCALLAPAMWSIGIAAMVPILYRAGRVF